MLVEIENLPCASVLVPMEVPGNEIVTAISGCLLPASVTTPVITVFCANKDDVRNKKNVKKNKLL